VNKRRKIPANTVLIRNAGSPKKATPFRDQFKMKACCITGIAIAKGVAGFLGIDNIEVKGATGLPNTTWRGRQKPRRKPSGSTISCSST